MEKIIFKTDYMLLSTIYYIYNEPAGINKKQNVM